MKGLRRKSMALVLVVMMVLMSFGVSFAESSTTKGPDIIIQALEVTGDVISRNVVFYPWLVLEDGLQTTNQVIIDKSVAEGFGYTFETEGQYELMIETTIGDSVAQKSLRTTVNVKNIDGKRVLFDSENRVITSGTIIKLQLISNQIEGKVVMPNGSPLFGFDPDLNVGELQFHKKGSPNSEDKIAWVNQFGAFGVELEDGSYEAEIEFCSYAPVALSTPKYSFEVIDGKLSAGQKDLIIPLSKTQVSASLSKVSGAIPDDYLKTAYVIFDDQLNPVINGTTSNEGWFKTAALNLGNHYKLTILQSFYGDYDGGNELLDIDLQSKAAADFDDLNVLKPSLKTIQLSLVLDNPFYSKIGKLSLRLEKKNDITGLYEGMDFPDGKSHKTNEGAVMLSGLGDGFYQVVGDKSEGNNYQLENFTFEIRESNVGNVSGNDRWYIDHSACIITVIPKPIKLYGQLLDPAGNKVSENTGNYGTIQIEQDDNVFISDINPLGKFEFSNLPNGVYRVTYDIANLPLQFAEPVGRNIEIKDGILVGGSEIMSIRLQQTQITAEIVKPDKTTLDESVFFEIFKVGEMRPIYSGMTKNVNGHQILKASSLGIGESYYVQVFGSDDFGFPRPVNFTLKDSEIVDLGQIALDSIQLEVHVFDKERAYAMVVIDKLTGFVSYPGYTGYYPDLGLVKISGLATGFYNLFIISEGDTNLFATTSKPVQINNDNSKLQVLNYDMNTFQVSGKMSVKDGVPALNGVVVIRQNGKIVQKAPTNFDGYFALSGLKPGPYSATISVVDSGIVFCKPVYFKIQNDGSYSGKALQLNVTGFQEDRVIPDALDKPVGSETETTVALTWSEGSDDVAVKGYEIYKNNVLVGETEQLDYVVTGLTPNKAYNFTIKTIDTSGNKSYNSTALRITTLKDVAKPSAITDLTASNTTRTSVELSWNASTDNVGIKQYEVYRNGTRIKTTTDTAYKVMNLSPNKSYTFEVYAVDTSGNRSNVSNAVFVKTNK